MRGFVAAWTVAAVVASEYPSYTLPSVDINAPSGLVALLQANGIAAIRNIPQFASTRQAYMASAAACLSSPVPLADRLYKQLRDLTEKQTFSTSVHDGVSEALRAQCPTYAAAYDAYSTLLDATARTVAVALDANATAAATPLAAVVADGKHLDHFHGYANPSTNQTISKNDDDLSLEMHTDNGLFLLTSAPLFYDRQPDGSVVAIPDPNPDAGLVIELAAEHNRRVRPVLRDDELVIMVGQGLRDWGNFGHAFPAVLHGMIMPRNAPSSVLRGFSGRMLLLQGHVEMANTGMTFDAYGQSIARHLRNEDSGIASLACPIGRSLVAMDGACTVGIWAPGPSCSKTKDECMFQCNNEHTADDCKAEKCCVKQSEQQGIDCWMVCTLPAHVQNAGHQGTGAKPATTTAT
ncbi:hypothetical protein SDRG_00909 [Saprolegnia diclina VS20]|uniref:Isopenicillin N synthase-like Fe(2+) 2OG dioxygenase domain-containing protein n=1 Tax=Saprolegnia diclina (strain VS20) TaxID=1156394 RepID=T0SGM1_SAPDV|nr:hypothetical protein SDRG_00909 [Saprolegnia diclina VS20]EQC42067.1 hypothetical protein SDRG_00909 [Saprolegnia diclina VS20]|eukprot:XP_008604636.1 hypothetical protein SDRG_00909 [Saprolegnia diclina VS20]